MTTVHETGTPRRRTPARRLRRLAAAAAVLTAGVLALAGCGLQPATAFVPAVAPASIKAIPNLPPGASLTVTSKNFTEQIILGKMAVLAARAAGFHVTDMTNVPGSQPARQLMLDGGADITWDYTGTAWLTYLGHSTGIPDKQQQFQAVRKADLHNGLTWLPPAALNNTYALAVRSAARPQLDDISKLSQLKDLPVKDRTFCVESEFNSRPDGFRPMLKHYGLTLGAADGVPNSNVTVLDTGTVYTATARGTCNFGEVFTTDGRIKALHLTVLQDDEHFFPSYNVAPIVNTDTLNKYPQLSSVLEQISRRLTNTEQQGLNYLVDVKGEEPATVAFDWMKQEGLITTPTNP